MDDKEFLRQFANCTLPTEQWTHRAHVKAAYIYLREYPFAEAQTRMRTGIKSYNMAHHVPEGATRGYNETTTCAMMHVVGATATAYGEAFPTRTADDFCDTLPQLMNKHVLRLFYSPQRRMHKDAKTQFIAPDQTQLPRIQMDSDETPSP